MAAVLASGRCESEEPENEKDSMLPSPGQRIIRSNHSADDSRSSRRRSRAISKRAADAQDLGVVPKLPYAQMEVASWLNWVNWSNWNNWRDWNNWRNWSNWSNWFNF
jgi:hypothetical protein